MVYNNQVPPAKEWALKAPTGQELDGDSLSYLDMMERSMVEERRRQRERAIMEEGKNLWMQKKQEQLDVELRDQEELRELAHVQLFGKPGHGAPTGNIRKKKFTEYQLQEPSINGVTNDDSAIPNGFGGDYEYGAAKANPFRPPQDMRHLSKSEPDISPDALTFGRPGCGAPVRTRSGRLRTALIGNPEIRFQPNESVQKTIYNTIRYQADRDTKEQYHRALEEQIQERKGKEQALKDYDRAFCNEMTKYEGSQWGRPGPGGPYWRERALTGQGFFEKMGWSSSADPRRRTMEIKHVEAEDMKREMAENEVKKHLEYDDYRSDVGLELVPLMKEKQTGKPRKDPATGYMLSHSLPTTDVTQSKDPNRHELPAYPKKSPLEEKRQYYDELAYQVSTKHHIKSEKMKSDEAQQMMHFQRWDTFWGRPGYGAPREGKGPQKENLMKILHYPSSKSPTNVELITLERLPLAKP